MNLPKMKTYCMTLNFIDINDRSFTMVIDFTTEAPHYEAAVSQALVMCQEICRENNGRRTLFFRITKS